MDKGFQMIDRRQPALGPQPTAGCRGVPAEMRTDFFDYDLPAHLIAQEPCAERDQARLLVLNRAGTTLAHDVFHELPKLLSPGDLLILNDTQVMPARLVGRRARTGGKWEGLFLRQLPDGLWELLCQSRGRLTPGETLLVEPGPLQLHLVSRSPVGHWLAQPNPAGGVLELLQASGQVPLPPYIRKGRAGPGDRARYQTV